MCEQVRQWTFIGMWCPGQRSFPLGTAVVGVGGGVGVQTVISRSICLTSVGKDQKTICEEEQFVCHDLYLGYPEQYFYVTFEICRIDVLFVGSSVCHCGAGPGTLVYCIRRSL